MDPFREETLGRKEKEKRSRQRVGSERRGVPVLVRQDLTLVEIP